MLFPDCRNDKDYNEDFLDGSGHDFVKGYDAAMESITESCVLSDDDILKTRLPDNVLDDVRAEYDGSDISTFADYLKYALTSYLESTRDEIITSLIDNMPDDVYDAIKTKVLRENEQKECPKEYYDTRKFMVTGKKE